MPAKDEIVARLKELAELTRLDEQNPNAFRVRAYEGAVQGLASVGDEVESMSESQLQKLPGVGKSTAKKIREYFDSGRIEKLEKLRELYPPEYRRLAKIPDVGPKTLAKLRSELDIQNLDDLRGAIERKELRKVSGLGPKTEANIARAIERLALTDQRWPIVEAMPVARRFVESMREVPGVVAADYCGSLRRLRETIGDLDILVATTEPQPVLDRFAELTKDGESLGRGSTKSSVRLESGMQIDLRVVEPAVYGAAMLYFTGSKGHNIKLRMRAIKRGWQLSEYGLVDAETERVVAAAHEEEIYRALELPFIPPPMREDSGEVELDELPDLLTRELLIGDLHVHTDLSGDGRSSLEAMLDHGRRRGYRYIAITDHAEDLAMIGVGREAMLAQREDLAALQGRYPEMSLLHGAELNIGPEGGLDYDPEFRAGFDWCVAAVHSHFDLDRDAQTKRILRAMEDPTVNVIGHLSGRRIGRRPGIELDIDAVLEGAARTGTALEINSALGRLDCSEEVLRRARGSEVRFVISTDAHHTREFERLEWGALQAQRGWVDPARVTNTWEPDRFRQWARAVRSG